MSYDIAQVKSVYLIFYFWRIFHVDDEKNYFFFEKI